MRCVQRIQESERYLTDLERDHNLTLKRTKDLKIMVDQYDTYYSGGYLLCS